MVEQIGEQIILRVTRGEAKSLQDVVNSQIDSIPELTKLTNDLNIFFNKMIDRREVH